MLNLIVIGILSAFFFSSTFVLNRAMSLAGGSWVWTASLRYLYTLLLLSGWLLVTGQARQLRAILATFRRHWCFWSVAGSVGFGAFYALLTFSSSYAPGWVVATTWQATILASPVVLLMFGHKVPAKGVLFTILIFAGIISVTVEQAGSASAREILLGVLPVIAAAFAYPIGNQLVWEARHGNGRLIPRIEDPAVDSSVGRVLLMVLGSLPFWIVLVALSQPAAPSRGQLLNTLLVALFSGVIATVLFYRARHSARTPMEMAAVDATQSTEVLFSLLGEIVFLHGRLPGMAGWGGVVLCVVGLILYIRSQTSESAAILPDSN
ncbi:multidrug resistance efflux transporter family protein [Geomonas sp.]|uniref:DMT family transporter n=1 Tax=Geomonas sp. TaxID=2651584 RepID=UPI002B479941|nr:multidrug resistance efflux transporter family protein [Geomonas sp.]HJV36164.1 multidrug resistance efflux transporter family protein [Geomonas sp.]